MLAATLLLTAGCTDYESTIGRLQMVNTHLCLQRQTLKGQVGELEASVDALDADLRATEESLLTCERDRDAARADMSELSKQLVAARTSRRDIEQELRLTRRRIEDLEAKIEDLKAEIENRESEIEDREAKIEVLEASLRESRDETASLRTAIEEMMRPDATHEP